MSACKIDRSADLKEKLGFLSRKFARSVMISSQVASLARELERASGPMVAEVASRLRALAEISPKVHDALEEFDHQSSVTRAEGFLADLAEDRSSAPPEIVPVIDYYIARLREVISQSWDRMLSRRELDASVMQVRLSYSQDLDRILQGLLPG